MKLAPLRQAKGLVCYYVHRERDGSIRAALYRPVRGPWTPTLRKLVPTAHQGIALEADSLVPDAIPEVRPSLIRTELRARQGSLDL